MATRAVTDGGSTLSRYCCGCLSNMSQDGMETTRERMPAASNCSMRGGGKAELAAGGDQDQLGIAARRVAKHIGAARKAGRRRIDAPVENRQRLAGEDERRRLVSRSCMMVAIGLDHLVGIAGPDEHDVGHGAERGELFHRLMRRAVFAVAQRIVGEDENATVFA